ncbi:MAG: carbonic anhydrase [Bacteroidales bacterium]|nr:carbonic anhydrase [Bacteroidales bacterium]
MKTISLYAGCSLFIASLLFGTSSCTSKSNNASVQPSNEFTTESVLAELDNDDPLTSLKKGNERFMSGKLLHIHQDTLKVKELVSGQNPKAVIIGCSDSRVTPEILFDQGMGDLFVIRTAGNVMGDYELGSIEYAADHLHTKLILVLGHSGCGAIHAMIEHAHDEKTDGYLATIIDCLKSEEEEQEVLKSSHDVACDAVRANVIHGVKQLRECDPVLKNLYKNGEIQIMGAVYDLESGKVDFLSI